MFATFMLVGSPAAASDFSNALVKLQCTNGAPSFSSPWQTAPEGMSTGSGIWIGKRRILTNEHVIRNALEITVQSHASSITMRAKVAVASPAMDLAIVEVDGEDPNSFIPEFSASMPAIRSTVQVYGFPDGGESLSVTEGIVSRIEYGQYYEDANGIRIQIDAAVNPGNSGGAAFVNGKLVGLVFQRAQNADNIGYLIPTDEVQSFLEDVSDGSYAGKPQLPVKYQALLNPALRESIDIPSNVSGILIQEPYPSTSESRLMCGDVVTHVGGYRIESDGQVSIEDHFRVGLGYLVDKFSSDSEIAVKVYRKGTQTELNIPVSHPKPRLLAPLYGRRPSYVLCGPLVFTTATSDYVAQLESHLVSAPTPERASVVHAMRILHWRQSPLVMRRYDVREHNSEELVVVSNWLPHEIGVGYATPATQIVSTVNGTKVTNMSMFAALLRDLQSEYVTFTFVDNHAEALTFKRDALERATAELMSRYGIAQRVSPDLLKIWTGTSSH